MVERERREYLRIEDSGSVTYQKILPPPQTPSRSGMRENISGGGIKLVTTEGFTPGTILKLKMELSDNFQKINIETTGKVIWSKEKKIGEHIRYEMGIAYLDILESERKKIINYVFTKQRFQRLMQKTIENEEKFKL
jgi:c-di-GMP-binding flagellar brake protein YcgR